MVYDSKVFVFLTMHCIDFIRMERQRREDELKGRSSKKGQDAEQSLLSRVRFHCQIIWIHVVESGVYGFELTYMKVLN